MNKIEIVKNRLTHAIGTLEGNGHETHRAEVIEDLKRALESLETLRPIYPVTRTGTTVMVENLSAPTGYIEVAP